MNRRAFDLYPTHSKLSHVLLQRVNLCGLVLEPFSGPGKMADVLRSYPELTVVTNELQSKYLADYHTDYTDVSSLLHREIFPDWVVTNPPFF